MSDTIRWGILGCGKIANKFAADLKLVEDAVLSAIASRNAEKGAAFCDLHKPGILYNSYEDLATSADVDAIYVATPHGFHYENVMLCLQHRKAVLCEKAFALNLPQAREMVDFARKQKVFLMEAFWTKFLPQYEKVMEIIQSGRIGEVKFIQSDFGFKAPEPKAQRLFDPLLGGGSLLDIGIYPVFLAQSILGKPTHVHAFITPYESGVDEQCAITMKFAGGALAVLSSTFAADTPVEAMIAGTAGRIVIRDRFHNAQGNIELVMNQEQPQKIEVHREKGFGYQFEVRHVNQCLRKGLTESPVMTHADTLMLMETLDRVRKSCGVRYAVDGEGGDFFMQTEPSLWGDKSTVLASVEKFLQDKGFSVVAKDFNRPWGGFFVLDESEAEKFGATYFPGIALGSLKIGGKLSPKILMVQGNKRLSWQYHHRRAEIWKLVAGTAGVVTSATDEEGKMQVLKAGEVIRLNKGLRHRLAGLAGWGMVAEIWQHTDPSNPSDEDDIVRVQDDFGR